MTFQGGHQVDALSALITAIGLPSAPPAISGTPPSASQTGSVSPSPASASRNASLIGPIVGGAIAGIALLGLVVGIWCLRHKRARKAPTLPTNQTPATSAVHPFTAQSNSSVHPPARLPWAPPPRKRPLAQDGRLVATQIKFTSLDSSTPSSVVSEQGNREMAMPPSPSALPTEALVRILNGRLQNREWNAEEAPPDYPVAT